MQKSGYQLSKKVPAMKISGASIAFGAMFLIIPGFATDLLVLIFPVQEN